MCGFLTFKENFSFCKNSLLIFNSVDSVRYDFELRLFVYAYLKSKGPSTVSWGTPVFTVCGSLKFWFLFTNCCLFSRKLSKIFSTLPLCLVYSVGVHLIPHRTLLPNPRTLQLFRYKLWTRIIITLVQIYCHLVKLIARILTEMYIKLIDIWWISKRSFTNSTTAILPVRNPFQQFIRTL